MNLLFANDRRGEYPPSWYAETAEHLPRQKALQGEVSADVCVVGAGYTGLSAALHLARAGRRVVVIEAHRVGFGASGRNGGQVGSGQRLDTGTLEKLFGPEDARKLWDLGEAAKALTKALVAELAPEAMFRPGVAHACWSAADVAHETEEVERLSARYGYGEIRVLDRAGIAGLTGTGVFAGGSVDSGSGHLHPLRFALGLARAALATGAVIHERSCATEVRPGLVRTEHGAVKAAQIVLAANGYLGALDRRVAARVMPINNFIAATEPLDRFPEILPGDEAVADSRFVVNYWRRSHDNRLLFGGGESYGYRFPRVIAKKVRRPMLEVYPQLRGIRIDRAWGGTLAITMRRLPFFMPEENGILSVSGYSGHGVAMATFAGKLIAEAATGQSEGYQMMAKVKAPPFPGGPSMRNPLLALAMSWYALRDRIGA